MRILLVLGLAALLAACGDKGNKDAAPQATVEGRNTVIFPAGSPQIASLVTVPVEPRRETVLTFNGRLVWNEERTVRVFAPFGGRVTGIAVRPGDRIAEGQTLATVSAPDLGVAQAEARKAEQDYALAQKSLARVEELQAAGVASTKELLAAQSDLARAGSERERAQAKLKLYGRSDTVDQTLQLRSPLAGVVVERNINPGQELRPDNQGDKALFVVSDPTQLWFLLDVTEKDIGAVKPGTEIRIATTSLGDDRAIGRVTHVSDFVDPQTRTVKVRGTVSRSDPRLKAEMYMVAELRVPAPDGFLAPTRAIYLRGEQNYVFVDQGGGRYVRVQIKAGPVLNGHQVVLAGLSANDKVVVDGNLLLERLLAAKD